MSSGHFSRLDRDINQVQGRFVTAALDPNKPFAVPGIMRWPVLQHLTARLMAFGIRPEHVKD